MTDNKLWKSTYLNSYSTNMIICLYSYSSLVFTPWCYDVMFFQLFFNIKNSVRMDIWILIKKCYFFPVLSSLRDNFCSTLSCNFILWKKSQFLLSHNANQVITLSVQIKHVYVHSDNFEHHIASTKNKSNNLIKKFKLPVL